MAKKFRDLVAKMPPEDQAQVQQRVEQMMAQMLLAELRKHAKLTQQQLADAIGIKQPALSQLESQTDMQISTLRRVIEALGGKLELIAHLPHGDVRITQFENQAG